MFASNGGSGTPVLLTGNGGGALAAGQNGMVMLSPDGNGGAAAASSGGGQTMVGALPGGGVAAFASASGR